eukprot:scaffold6573_cov350-Prasinococcus_capsulatus_cf.AAC.2
MALLSSEKTEFAVMKGFMTKSGQFTPQELSQWLRPQTWPSSCAEVRRMASSLVVQSLTKPYEWSLVHMALRKAMPTVPPDLKRPVNTCTVSRSTFSMNWFQWSLVPHKMSPSFCAPCKGSLSAVSYTSVPATTYRTPVEASKCRFTCCSKPIILASTSAAVLSLFLVTPLKYG